MAADREYDLSPRDTGRNVDKFGWKFVVMKKREDLQSPTPPEGLDDGVRRLIPGKQGHVGGRKLTSGEETRLKNRFTALENKNAINNDKAHLFFEVIADRLLYQISLNQQVMLF